MTDEGGITDEQFEELIRELRRLFKETVEEWEELDDEEWPEDDEILGWEW